jgi:hypothetical protein
VKVRAYQWLGKRRPFLHEVNGDKDERRYGGRAEAMTVMVSLRTSDRLDRVCILPLFIF